MPQDVVDQCKHIKWFHGGHGHDREEEQGHEDLSTEARRILLADDYTVRVYDVSDHDWQATINGSLSNLGIIANVAFGHSTNDVLVFSDFGVKVTIWSLITSRGIEIRDPKYSVSCYDYRPRTGHLAIVTRAAAQDVMMILRPGSSEVVNSVELLTTDAQAIQWDYNGHWIAIRDAASSGDKVLIYTADGHHFRTCTGSKQENDIGLGIKSVSFSPNGMLLAGDYKGTVTVFAKNTVRLCLSVVAAVLFAKRLLVFSIGFIFASYIINATTSCHLARADRCV